MMTNAQFSLSLSPPSLPPSLSLSPSLSCISLHHHQGLFSQISPGRERLSSSCSRRAACVDAKTGGDACGRL